MGLIEDEFKRTRNTASLAPTGGGGGAALLRNPAAPPPAAPAQAPQRAALLTAPSPGQQVREAIARPPAGPNLGELVAQRNPGAAPPAPPMDMRAALERAPAGPTLGETLGRKNMGPPAPDLRAQLERAPAGGPTLGETLNRKGMGPPEPGLREQLARGQSGPTGAQIIAERAAATANATQGPPPADLRAQLERGRTGPSGGQIIRERAAATAQATQGPPQPDLRAQLERGRVNALGTETVGQRLAAAASAQNPPPGSRVKPVSLQTLLDKVPGHSQAFAGAPAPAGATAGAAGAAPAGAAAGAAAAAPKAAGAAGEGWYARATKAMSEAAKPMVPAGGGVIGKAAGAVGVGAMGLAKKALPYVAPVIEGTSVARVALDPKSDGYDVATQAAEGAGRIGTAGVGAGIGGALGAMTGPAAPILAPVGALAGGVAGYVGGDAAIKKLRSVFGLETSSPIEQTRAREKTIADAARATATAQAAKAGKPTPAKAPAAAAPGVADAAGAPVQQGQRAWADTPNMAPAAGLGAGRGQPDQGLLQQIAALEAQQAASPIARTVIGGGGSQVFYKDGSQSPLVPGTPIPDDVAQFNAIHSQLDALRAGRPLPQTPQGSPEQQPGVRSAAGKQGVQANLLPNQQVLHAEAVNQGYDPLRAMMISSIETGGKFDAAAKNPKSSAFGLVQMTKANRDSYGLSDNEWIDPAVQARTGIDFMKKTDAALGRQLGRAPTPAESYMGHLLGPTGAASVLLSDPSQPVLDVVRAYAPKDANAIVNNNGMKGMTVGQAVAKWNQLADAHMAQLGGAEQQGGAQMAVMTAPAVAQNAVMTAAAGAGALPGGVVPEQVTGINQPVHIIKGMAQSYALPNGDGYSEVPKTIYDAARRSSNGFDENGPVVAYLDNVNQGYNYAANPTQAELDKQAVQGQYQNRGQVIAGEYQNAGQRIASEANKAAAQANAEGARRAIIPLGGGESIDPATGMPVKQPTVGVYMKEGVPTYIDPPAQAKAAKTPSPASIERLRQTASDPHSVALFEATYGPGSSALYLK